MLSRKRDSHCKTCPETDTHSYTRIAPCTDLKFICATQAWHSWGQQEQQHVQGSGSHSFRPRASFATWDLVQLPSLLLFNPRLLPPSSLRVVFLALMWGSH